MIDKKEAGCGLLMPRGRLLLNGAFHIFPSGTFVSSRDSGKKVSASIS